MRKMSYILLLVLLAPLYSGLAKPAYAIVPVIQNVVVWQSGSDVIVNVTVFHQPVEPGHHVDKIEVNVSGTIHVFNIVQNVTTFTYPCNLGPIEGTPTAQVRAHCLVDQYSAWTEPIQIPELQVQTLLLLLIIGTALAAFASSKIRSRRS